MHNVMRTFKDGRSMTQFVSSSPGITFSCEPTTTESPPGACASYMPAEHHTGGPPFVWLRLWVACKSSIACPYCRLLDYFH